MNIADLIAAVTAAPAETQTPVETPITPVAPEDVVVPARPPLFALVLHNDDTTFPDFVTRVLNDTCGLSAEESKAKMLEAHTTGKSCVFIGTSDLAETRLQAVNVLIAGAIKGQDFMFARTCELTFTVEPERDGDARG